MSMKSINSNSKSQTISIKELFQQKDQKNQSPLSKKQLIDIQNQIIAGNKPLYLKYIITIQQLLKLESTRQVAFQGITELAISAAPSLVNDLNNDIFTQIDRIYNQSEGLEQYIYLWGHMYNGKPPKEDYPNVAKTLGKISLSKERFTLSERLSVYLKQFQKNLSVIQEKKVEFFEDFDDSEMTQSAVDESRISDIVYMDIMQIKNIRQKVESHPIDQQMCSEYLLKMRTFLNLKTNNLNQALLAQFNKEKLWAKHFIQKHPDYLKANRSLPHNIEKIELSRQQIFYGDVDQSKRHSMKKPRYENSMQAERFSNSLNSKPLILNQLSIDQSKYTEKNIRQQPLFNMTQDVHNQESFTSFKHDDKKIKAPQMPVRTVQPLLRKPVAEETLPLDESLMNNSSMNNLSIPHEVPQPVILKTTPVKRREKPIQKQIESQHKSQYPFANSQTNYISELKTRSPYEIYKGNNFDVNSPARQRMIQNDLDSDSLEQNVIVASKNRNSQGLTKTNVEFTKKQRIDNEDYLRSQQLSPRSAAFAKSPKTKKRLSQLTSQKKLRRNFASRTQIQNFPQQYVCRPYSNHFPDNETFNVFKRNCWEDQVKLYTSIYLDIECKFKKLAESKLQIQLFFQNKGKNSIDVNVLYKIPKCFKIEKVSKINRKFELTNTHHHIFNLSILQFPLQMCLLDLSYQSENMSHPQQLKLPFPVTIKSFIQTLVASKQQWLQNWQKLNNFENSFRLYKTFMLNRNIIDPTQFQRILSKQFLTIGPIQGYSVQQYGCICYYKELHNLLYMVRISIRVDHIVTVEILSQKQTTENQRDFMKYYLELIVTLLAKYSI